MDSPPFLSVGQGSGRGKGRVRGGGKGLGRDFFLCIHPSRLVTKVGNLGLLFLGLKQGPKHGMQLLRQR